MRGCEASGGLAADRVLECSGSARGTLCGLGGEPNPSGTSGENTSPDCVEVNHEHHRRRTFRLLVLFHEESLRTVNNFVRAVCIAVGFSGVSERHPPSVVWLLYLKIGRVNVNFPLQNLKGSFSFIHSFDEWDLTEGMKRL